MTQQTQNKSRPSKILLGVFTIATMMGLTILLPDPRSDTSSEDTSALKDKLCAGAYQIFRYSNKEAYEIVDAPWEARYRVCETTSDLNFTRGTKTIAVTYAYDRRGSKVERTAELEVDWDGERVQKVRW